MYNYTIELTFVDGTKTTVKVEAKSAHVAHDLIMPIESKIIYTDNLDEMKSQSIPF